MINKLISFLNESPTAFQAIGNATQELDNLGYQALKENQIYHLEKGGKYYVTRNGSSLIAFNIGNHCETGPFKIVASHSDCPSFKLKPNAVIKDGKQVKLNTEVYGGALLNPWFDRPLGLAGRLIIKEKGQLKIMPYVLDEDFCVIPSLAIHMNREANNGYKLNPQVDLLPLVTANQDFDLKDYLKEKAGVEEIVNFDLYLYPREKGFVWSNGEYFSANHIDNLECAYTSLQAFENCFDSEAINVLAVFDNEEVGSLTRQGANSDFLKLTLERITKSLNMDYASTIAKSMLISADNAHAVHPNHNDKADQTNRPYMNEGLVIKYNANQSYTSDAVSSAIFVDMLEKHDIPYQYFANRSDMRGGSTLGNISNSEVSIISLDIGLPQLAMHSCIETAGTKDAETMVKALNVFYSSELIIPEII